MLKCYESLNLMISLMDIPVTALLFICQWLVAFMWACRVDPDNAAIPYLTALGDLIGTSLLYGAFSFLHFVHDEEIIKS
uniref:SLC41A/MgtE integral membrane domain-containing protein n=1 Tax=Panagrolaimus sp. JU765 TaxID=591449 RepID=A0AC34RAI8_9BILA